jgi:hypothetical protein
LHARYGSGIGALEAVLPSRRSQLYFEEHLAELSAHGIPKIPRSIEL